LTQNNVKPKEILNIKCFKCTGDPMGILTRFCLTKGECDYLDLGESHRTCKEDHSVQLALFE